MVKQSYRAFTLMELVVVMILIGFLTAIIIPRFIEMSEQVNLAALQAVVGAVESGSAANYAGYVKNTDNGIAVRVHDDCKGIAIQAALPNGLPENFVVISEKVSAKPGNYIGTCTITHNITGFTQKAKILLTESAPE